MMLARHGCVQGFSRSSSLVSARALACMRYLVSHDLCYTARDHAIEIRECNLRVRVHRKYIRCESEGNQVQFK